MSVSRGTRRTCDPGTRVHQLCLEDGACSGLCDPAKMSVMPDEKHGHLYREQQRERAAKMSFAEEVVEAIGELVEAKLDYAETRRGPGAEFANHDPVYRAEERLQGLLSRVKFST